MRPDKPQFWTGSDVNIAMTEMTTTGKWEPIKNLTARTLVDVHIDSREMAQGIARVIQDGVVIDVITSPVQKNTFITSSQSLIFETLAIPTGTFSFSREALTLTTGSDIAPLDMMYNNDGTRLYVLEQQHRRIREYTLTTPYDISTGSLKGTVLGVGGQDANPRSMMYNNDGTRLYVLGDQHNNIFEYSLTTPYDISTATYTSIALSIGGQDANPLDMMYNNDGTRLYVLGDQHNNIFEYSLTTPYDISTATYTRIVLNVSNNTTSILLNNDGTRLYTICRAVWPDIHNRIIEFLSETIWSGNVKIRTINN